MKYRKKPVVIEAVQYDGHNKDEIRAFTEDVMRENTDGSTLGIMTLEGVMRAEPGDFIIRGVKGEYYPCKYDIFAATYEAAE